MKKCGLCSYSSDNETAFAEHMRDVHRWGPSGPQASPSHVAPSGKRIIVRTYKGSQSGAASSFQRDAAKLAEQGYFPISQSWAQGSWSCGAFIVALILCFVLVGILVFIYMLLVKPAGTLTVTYELRATAT